MKVFYISSLTMLLFISSRTSAATVAYTDESAFQAALTGSYSLVNLEVSALPTNTDVTSAGANLFFNSLGLNFVNSQLMVTGQGSQIPKAGRDRLIINGAGTPGGETMLFNMSSPIDGVGAWSNLFAGGDGGFIRAFSGLNGSGALVGEAPFGVEVPLVDRTGFGGLIGIGPINSVEVTCTMDGDLICGVFDIQFGTVAAVPIPAAAWLFGSALLGLGVMKRKKT